MMAMSSSPSSPIEALLARIAGDAGALAALRRGVGRNLEESPDSWPYVFEVARSDRWREAPAHLALGLFALHHQSQDAGSMNQEGWGLGKAIRVLNRSRAKRDASAEGVERRFRAALASETLDSLGVHLRGLVTLLRGDEVPLDYPRLYRDLCTWSSPNRRPGVCLRWAREYFHTSQQEQEQEKEAEG